MAPALISAFLKADRKMCAIRLSALVKGSFSGWRSIARSYLGCSACDARVATAGSYSGLCGTAADGATMTRSLSKPTASHASH
jgi:hypothetical protein